MTKSVSIHTKKFKLSVPSRKIQKTVDAIAKSITKDFKDKNPLFISVLNGSFLFTADCLRKIKMDAEVSFVKVASYAGTRSTGQVNTLIGLNENIQGRNVIVLEDIIDSGSTIEKVVSELKKRKPEKISIATLFLKPAAYRKQIKLDYVGMEVPNDFLVGYGLDYNGLGRNLSDIYTLI